MDAWEEAKGRFPIGSLVQGVVTAHHPFGFFVDLGDPVAVGLVQITEIADEGRLSEKDFPTVGSPIEAVVLGHKADWSRQVWLGMKPSHLRAAGRAC